MKELVFAFWFFLPAGVANVTPILAARMPLLRNWNAPVDHGLYYRGKRLLGDHKTWRGIACGVAAGVIVALAQAWLYERYTVWGPVPDLYAQPVLLGLALSMGALGGDALKSFVKRQVGVPSGKSWFPFDQIDYIVGACVLSAAIVVLPLASYVGIAVVWFVMHLLFSYVGYLTHFKKDPI